MATLKKSFFHSDIVQAAAMMISGTIIIIWGISAIRAFMVVDSAKIIAKDHPQWEKHIVKRDTPIENIFALHTFLKLMQVVRPVLLSLEKQIKPFKFEPKEYVCPTCSKKIVGCMHQLPPKVSIGKISHFSTQDFVQTQRNLFHSMFGAGSTQPKETKATKEK